jgi:hypothetical protein
MKKRKETVIGEEALYMWGASCFFSPLRAPVKVWTPPEFH